MKRVWILFALLACLSPVTGHAAQMYENAGELYQAWMQGGGPPDYVTGVWSTDGSGENLTIGIFPGEQGREILEMIRDDSSVTFVYSQKYSLDELQQIQEAVYPYAGKGLGIVCFGIYDDENCVKVDIHEDYETNPETQAMVSDLKARYGDAIQFVYGDFYVTTTTVTEPDPTTGPLVTAVPSQTRDFGSWLLFACFAAMALFVAGLLGRSRKLMLVDGGVAGQPRRYSVKSVRRQVRDALLDCPTRVDERLRQTLSAWE